MSPWSVTPVAVSLSSKNPNPNIRLLYLFGLMEATSYAGAMAFVFWVWDSAWICVGFTRPNTIGTATATNPAALGNSFLLRSSLRATPSVMIRTILSHQGITRPLLIFRRPLGMIDDENLHRALLRFQFQTKLLLNSCENGRPGEFGRCAVSA